MIKVWKPLARMSEHGSTPEVHSVGSIWNRPGDADSVASRRSNAFVLPVQVGSSIVMSLIDCSVLRTGAHVSVAPGASAARAAVAVASAAGSGVRTNGPAHAGSITGSPASAGSAASTRVGGASGAPGDFALSPQLATRR